MMKSFGWAAVWLGVGGALAAGAAAPNPPALAWHFVGAEAFARSKPDTVWNETAKLKTFANLGAQTHSTLTAHLPEAVGLSPQALSADVIALLVDDVLRRESAAWLEGDRPGAGDWALAVQTDAAGTDRWRSTLLTVGRRLKLGEPQPFKAGSLTGWTIPGAAGQRGFAFVAHNGWVLVASGFANDSKAAAWAKTLAEAGRPLPALANDWLEVEFRPAALGWRHALPFAGPIQQVAAAWSWQGRDVRTTAKLTVAEPVKPLAGDWLIPKGIVRDPLVSFTAVRNLSAFFGRFDVLKGLGADALPDQWFGWSRSDVVFIDDFAVPVKDSAATFAHLEQTVPATYNPPLLDVALGKWMSATNQSRLLWRGLPVFVPYLNPAQDGDRHFIQGGIFPLTESKTNLPPAAPAELWAQFEQRNDLIYYDWEITAARISAYEQASPFVGLFLPPAKPRESGHAVPWLTEVSPQLNNVVTEIAADGSRELSLTRRSQLGLTGFELWVLTRWLDSATFPKFPYSAPKKPTAGVRAPDAAGQP